MPPCRSVLCRIDNAHVCHRRRIGRDRPDGNQVGIACNALAGQHRHPPHPARLPQGASHTPHVFAFEARGPLGIFPALT